MNDLIAINDQLTELKIMMAKEETRNEERHKTLTANLDRALTHSHDAKVMSSSNTASIGIIENKLDLLDDEVADIKKSLDKIEDNRFSTARRIITTVGTSVLIMVITGIGALVWKHIYNN